MEQKASKESPKAKEVKVADVKSATDKVSATPRESEFAKVFSFFKDDDAPVAQRIDAKNAIHKHKSVMKLVTRQSYVIIMLVFIIILLMPILQPVHKYMAMRTDKAKQPLVSLTMPNHTDSAVLSWAATGITEIMTFGFGDIDQQLLSQRYRFTDEGWQSFVTAVFGQDLVKRFKMQQLVLTTVPVNVPVVAAKGIDEEIGYNWVVEMPVIMTYTTNNNAQSQDRKIVRLTIVRVPTHVNKAGIGISKWRVI